MAALVSWQHLLSTVFAVVVTVLHLAVACRAITRRDRSPASRVAWVAVIMSLPVVGIFAYAALGETSIGRRRVTALHRAVANMPVPYAEPVDRAELPPRALELFDLGRSINGFRPVAGNRIHLLGDPQAPADDPARDSRASVGALVAAIEEATDTVHIAFYIWLDDGCGGRVTDAVSAAARRGVRCRVMVDALGSRGFVASARWRQLTDAGVHAVATLDDIPRLGRLPVGRLDLRNHRKIVVIDNRISFCGSQNCADPEFRIAPRYAPWIDILLRCEGPIVRQEQLLFCGGWTAETGEDLTALPTAAPDAQTFDDGVVAQMFGTGPTTPGDAMSDMFVATIFAATHDLLVTTPYFVPDEALLRALCAAPRRGVRTTIVFPAHNNSPLVAAACRSTYPALLDAGVAIYEYPLGLLHTKSITVDGRLALVGSANMDRRSLQLNFENNLLVADAGLTAAVRARQHAYLSVSSPVDADRVAAWSFPRRLVQNGIGMLGPLL